MTCCKGDTGDTKRFATGRNLMWMVSIQLSIQGKQKEPLQCYPTSTQPWTSVCWWMLWLTGDSSRWMHWKRLHLSSLKLVQRDGKVAYPCSCVPGCASRPSYIWMKLFQEENCWRSMALNIKKKKPAERLLSAVHVFAEDLSWPLNMWKTYELGTLQKKNQMSVNKCTA